MDITEAHATSLAEKLNALDLTAEEREVLGQLLGYAESEVEGFAGRDYLSKMPPVQGFNIGMPPTKGFNIGMPPTKGSNIGMPPNGG